MRGASVTIVPRRVISEGPDRYHVGENVLLQLDKQGRRITGDPAEKYVLRKELPP